MTICKGVTGSFNKQGTVVDPVRNNNKSVGLIGVEHQIIRISKWKKNISNNNLNFLFGKKEIKCFTVDNV